MSVFKRIRELAVPSVVGVAFAVVGGACGFGVPGGDGDVGRRLPGEIEQTAAATDNGIVVRVHGAAFSGTETLLRIDLDVTDERVLGEALGVDGGSLVVVGPAGTGFEGPFAEGAIEIERRGGGETLFVLPPLVAAEDYDVDVLLTIRSMMVSTNGKIVPVAGEWALMLAGPAASVVTDLLRVERLVGEPIAVGGAEAVVSAVRSSSGTRVSIRLPGFLMLTQPTLLADGEELHPSAFAIEGDTVTSVFAATAFGTVVDVRLGAVASLAVNESMTFGIRLEDVLARKSSGPGPRAVLLQDVFLGDPERVLAAERRTSHGLKLVAITVAGSVAPGAARPVILNGEGKWLRLSGTIVGYGKDDEGRVQEGTTEIEFVVGSADLTTVTVMLGPGTAVDQGSYAVRLVPE